MSQPMRTAPGHDEAHDPGMAVRLNWLRAAVLGANDGVVSLAGLAVGIAAATTSRTTILTVGVAGLFAGALAMAAGEYVSVSSQRDSERALLRLERRELAESPEAELAELTALYRAKGLSPALAAEVAEQLTAHDAFAAHAEAELGIDPDTLANPWHAAAASFLAFTTGALLPLLAILLPAAARVPATVLVVAGCLTGTGYAGARLGRARPAPAIARNLIGGALAMAVTYGIGTAIGTGGA
ncbi:MAG: VIT1/CCC1 transporter family protein [Actinocrinis sp.]